MSKLSKKKVIPIRAEAAPAAGAVPREELVSLYKKSEKIYPRQVTGTYTQWRWVMVWFTQIIFYGLPWLMWNDRQAVLFDLGSRRFYIFNLVLYPQDFIYLTVILVICAYGLFLFTAVAGRVWCGYACPQSVYTEIFMWIERRFEGDRSKRLKIDKSGWSFEKVWRKSGKQLSWIVFAFLTGLTFVGYFTPIKTLGASLLALSLGPWETFWLLFYGFATYGNAGYMREQVCKYMCPYARFQSAMFDPDTLIVTYDEDRGEPRGSRARKVDAKQLKQGDCIDCTLCVQVCPTGIDIRDGLQYECISCGACIDVCNSVMDKMGSPRGLIRYGTQNAMEKGWTSAQIVARIKRPRVLIYSAVLLLIVLAFGVSLAGRSPFKVDVVRDRGALARIVDDGYVENVYRVQLMNATESTQHYRLGVEQLPQARTLGGEEVLLGPAQARWVPISVRIPPESAQRMGTGAHPLVIVVEQLRHGNLAQTEVREKSTFMIPR